MWCVLTASVLGWLTSLKLTLCHPLIGRRGASWLDDINLDDPAVMERTCSAVTATTWDTLRAHPELIDDAMNSNDTDKLTNVLQQLLSNQLPVNASTTCPNPENGDGDRSAIPVGAPPDPFTYTENYYHLTYKDYTDPHSYWYNAECFFQCVYINVALMIHQAGVSKHDDYPGTEWSHSGGDPEILTLKLEKQKGLDWYYGDLLWIAKAMWVWGHRWMDGRYDVPGCTIEFRHEEDLAVRGSLKVVRLKKGEATF